MNKAITVVLLWVEKVIQDYQEGKANMLFDLDLTLNFNSIGGAVRDNPGILDSNPPFTINAEGDVLL